MSARAVRLSDLLKREVSADPEITGVTADGREVPIFKNGGWAF